MVWVIGIVVGSGILLQLTEPLVGVACTAFLLAAAWVARRTPMRGVLLVWAGTSLVGWVSGLVAAIPAFDAWLRSVPVPYAFLVVNSFKLIGVVAVALVARSEGWTRDRLYLRVGDPTARVGRSTLRWSVAAPIAIAIVAALFVLDSPDTHWDRWPVLLPLLPICLLGAVVNAFAEEFLFRHAPAAALAPVMGMVPMYLLTSLIFGLGHLTGNPGGVIGVAYTAVTGLVWVIAMVQTKGWVWNMVMHVFGDICVVVTLTLTLA